MSRNAESCAHPADISVPSVRANAPPALIDARDRFLAKLELGDVPPAHLGLDTRCLNWTGFRNRHGYGHFRVSAIRESPMLAHVVAYLFFRGDLASGEQVHHRCENEAYCRPEHLEAVPRSHHIANHNRSKRTARTNRSKRIIEVKQEVRDGRIYTVNVLESTQPRRIPGARLTRRGCV